MSAGIDHAGQSKTAQFAKESAGAVDRLFDLRFGQARIERDNRSAIADDPAGGLILAVAFELRALRQVRLGLHAKPVAALGIDQHIAVEKLNVDGMAGDDCCNLRIGWPPVLGELARRPSAGDDQPGVRRRVGGGRPEALKRFTEASRALPIHFGRSAKAGTNGVNVGIDQARNHRAPAEVDHFGGRPREFTKFRCAAGRGDVSSFDGERLADRRSRILGDDLAIDEQEFGGTSRSRHGAKNAHPHHEDAEETA
jgi:hypothetical protein